MAEKLLTEGWIKKYHEAWNKDEKLMKDLAKFSHPVQLGIDGSDQPNVQVDVKDGKLVYAGKIVEGITPGFVVTAKAEMWRKIAEGKQGIRAALLTKKINFKGSMATAMRYMSGLTGSLELFGKVDTDWE